MSIRSSLRTLAILLFSSASASAQDFEFYPGASYDPAIPTLKQIVGYGWGERITTHHEMERYLTALADASPRVQLREMGESWQGRKLYYLIISSRENMSRMAEIQRAAVRLSDPRTTSGQAAQDLIETTPSLVWLAYSVHGNEISGTDAALLLAYHLAAAQGDSVTQSILTDSVVIIDPLQNPDGRDRFVHFSRQMRGRWPDSDRQSAEHSEGWPGGRLNHYLFDMNRDWFAQTQKETRARLKAYLEWHPHVFVDLHEMGTDSTYYFAPPADPLNPELREGQLQWLRNFGRNNAKWFDRFRFDYFTREIFDSFYPGYGEGWPMFKGAIGMTYEQASVRGLVAERFDDTKVHYRDSVQRHFIASLSTAENAAISRRELVRHFYDYRRNAVEEGSRGPVREYLIVPGHDPGQAARLAGRLLSQGIEVKRARRSFVNSSVRSYYSEEQTSKEFPAGTFLISAAQPDKHLIGVLLSKHQSLEEEFIREQTRRQGKRLGVQVYDLTAWSVPLLTGVEAYRAADASSGDFEMLRQAPQVDGRVRGGEASVAYLIPWGTHSAVRALAWMLRHDIRVHSAAKHFVIELEGRDVRFEAGSLIVKRGDNSQDLHRRMEEAARSFGLDIHAADSSWVKDGVNFESNNVDFVKKPRVALAYDRPASATSAGATRYLIEQEYGYPVTALRTGRIRSADLSEYDVLILPQSFGYAGELGESGADRIRDWIRQGGTLVAFGSALSWLTQEKVELLEAKRERRNAQSKPEKKEGEEEPESETSEKDSSAADLEPEEEWPFEVLGAILRVRLDEEHWLAFGYRDGTNALVNSNRIYTPLKLDQGTNVGLYEDREKLVLSGFGFDETFDQIAGKAYLMHSRLGRGHVVAFAEDPNFRAFCDGLSLLFMNAVLLGPSR